MKKTKDAEHDVSDLNDSDLVVDAESSEKNSPSIVPPHMLDAIKASKSKDLSAKEKLLLDKALVTEPVKADQDLREESSKKPGFKKVTAETKSEAKPEETKSSRKTPIWDSLKDRQISLFSLPETAVSYHLSFFSEGPTGMLGGFQVPALISALENAFGKEYEFNVVDKKKVEIKRK